MFKDKNPAKPFFLVLGLALACAPAAWAQTAAPPLCALVPSGGFLAPGSGEVTIACNGIGDALGKQLADVMNRILQNRLDPQVVLVRLEEVDRVPETGVSRSVSEEQQQRIVKGLAGKPAAQVAITAHPQVEDSAQLAQGLAMALAMVGWQIENNQIRRRAPKELDPVPGMALVVKDRNSPPPKAQQLRAALTGAGIGSSLVSDAALAPDAVMVWIGRRPEFASTEPPK